MEKLFKIKLYVTNSTFVLFQLVHSKEYSESQGEASKAQPTLPTFGVVGTQPYPKEGKRHQELTSQLINAVADGHLPFTLVDRPSFRKLVQMLDPRSVVFIV